MIDAYNAELHRLKGEQRRRKGLEERIDYKIKWSRAVKNDLSKSVRYQFNPDRVTVSLYRPFVKQALYFSKQLNEDALPARSAVSGQIG